LEGETMFLIELVIFVSGVCAASHYGHATDEQEPLPQEQTIDLFNV
jgi:hypothetical protein